MELKFGHRVLAGDANIVYGISEPLLDKGRYLSPGNNGHYVLSDNDQTPYLYGHVKLDPDATEFLRGDKVEFSQDGRAWRLGEYAYKSIFSGAQYDMDGNRWKHCRYPRKDPLHGKTAIIDGKEYKLRLK